ncbi:MAG TPA: alcohol dehydrogenase catalytic domain-containing protein [Nitrospirales bacterium]|nr:alcohol dehydrogenase [Nitrospiraceae bacterium]HNP30779.1 alcohol dehydrogenase catalytic domain-containing protein [Nitrospirales bacterium]
MRGLVLHQELQLQANIPCPARQPREARIRVLQAGICSTDLQLVKGYMAFQGILGHEFVGIVDEAPDTALIGKRVVGEINAACRNCETCSNGHPTHCPHRTTLGIQGRDGAFADFLTLPVENLFVVPDSISDDQAVFIEPLAAACEIPQLVSIKPTDRVVVIGDGKLGVLCAQILALTGCAMTLLGRHSDRDTWLTHLGIKVTSHPADIPRGADIIVEATGSPEGLSTAMQLIRPRGTLVLKSTHHGNVSLNMAEFVIHEISLIGSRCGPFPPAIRLLETAHIRVDPLIHAHYPLTEGIVAMEKAAQRGVRKVMLHMT